MRGSHPYPGASIVKCTKYFFSRARQACAGLSDTSAIPGTIQAPVLQPVKAGGAPSRGRNDMRCFIGTAPRTESPSQSRNPARSQVMPGPHHTTPSRGSIASGRRRPRCAQRVRLAPQLAPAPLNAGSLRGGAGRVDELRRTRLYQEAEVFNMYRRVGATGASLLFLGNRARCGRYAERLCWRPIQARAISQTAFEAWGRP